MSSIFLDYTPNEKKLLSYIRQGHKPVLYMHPEEALRWRKNEWERMQNSTHYTEEMAIARIRQFGRWADEAAGKELQRIYTQKSDSVQNEEQRKTVNSEKKKTYDTAAKKPNNSATDNTPPKKPNNTIFYIITVVTLLLCWTGYGAIIGIPILGYLGRHAYWEAEKRNDRYKERMRRYEEMNRK